MPEYETSAEMSHGSEQNQSNRQGLGERLILLSGDVAKLQKDCRCAD